MYVSRRGTVGVIGYLIDSLTNIQEFLALVMCHSYIAEYTVNLKKSKQMCGYIRYEFDK